GDARPRKARRPPTSGGPTIAQDSSTSLSTRPLTADQPDVWFFARPCRAQPSPRDSMTQAAPVSPDAIKSAAQKLDAHVREIIDWHFTPETGTPFWLDWAKKAGWDPRKEVKSFADLARFDHFQDDALRGGPVNRWI